ncbi:hypothetical protein CDL12_03244 [Handroanthus impetiginosus]|uniref:Uncharacterized protein n=1 Tax=Handroanthus impetiginosus TaxID=429701 RepID=A0A2G9I2N8_9LAMI|nr:hypothetical protein CDL12_03244 [Handroanthus impetiginosus]
MFYGNVSNFINLPSEHVMQGLLHWFQQNRFPLSPARNKSNKYVARFVVNVCKNGGKKGSPITFTNHTRISSFHNAVCWPIRVATILQ